jgi:hypothetical protein
MPVILTCSHVSCVGPRQLVLPCRSRARAGKAVTLWRKPQKRHVDVGWQASACLSAQLSSREKVSRRHHEKVQSRVFSASRNSILVIWSSDQEPNGINPVCLVRRMRIFLQGRDIAAGRRTFRPIKSTMWNARSLEVADLFLQCKCLTISGSANPFPFAHRPLRAGPSHAHYHRFRTHGMMEAYVWTVLARLQLGKNSWAEHRVL